MRRELLDLPFPTGVSQREITANFRTTWENFKALKRLPGLYYNVLDYGVKGDGITDDTAAIQRTIDFVTSTGLGGVVLFPAGTYIVTARLNLASGVYMQGMGKSSIITNLSTRMNNFDSQGYFRASLLTDVKVRGFYFKGNGSWSDVGFANPYGAGTKYGFNNNDRAVLILGSTDIEVSNCFISGINQPFRVEISGATRSSNIQIRSNDLRNCGTAGIRAFDTDNIDFSGNRISGVYGNTADSVHGTDGSIFADGAYFSRCNRVLASYNIIDDIVRIGIVLEGNTSGTHTKAASIVGNVIWNLHDSKANEKNAGIWAEAPSVDDPISITGNTIFDSMYGITASDAVVTGNSVSGCFMYGINMPAGVASGNLIKECGIGVFGQITSGNSQRFVQVLNNYIRDCTMGGAFIENSRFGNRIEGNWIEDCGSGNYSELDFDAAGYVSPLRTDIGGTVTGSTSGATGTLIWYNNPDRRWVIQTTGTFTNGEVITITPLSGSGTGTGTLEASAAQILASNYGVRVRSYFDPLAGGAGTMVIKNNVFVSSADAGATTGQLYSLLSKAGGDATYQSAFIRDNIFSFTGTLAAYPACLSVTPCSLGLDTGTVAASEIADAFGNRNSKIPYTLDIATSGASGAPRCMGWATAAPASGTFQAGDYYLNSALSAGEALKFVCVVGGTPGTWESYGWGTTIGSAITFTNAVTIQGLLTHNSDYVFNQDAHMMRTNTLLGSDNRLLQITGAGSFGTSRGAAIQLGGNQHMSSPGLVQILAGNVTGGAIDIAMRDDQAEGFTLRQGSNNYIVVDTTNSAELITLLKPVVLSSALGVAGLSITSPATNDDPTETIYQNRLATTDATLTTLHTFTVPASTTYAIEALVIARRTGGVAGTAEDGARYKLSAVYKNVAGTATLIGAVTTVADEDQAAWDCAFSPTGATVRLQVTGAADNNITWHLSAARVYSLST